VCSYIFHAIRYNHVSIYSVFHICVTRYDTYMSYIKCISYILHTQCMHVAYTVYFIYTMHTCLIHIFIYVSHLYRGYLVYISHTHDTYVNKYVLHTKSLVCVKRLIYIYISHKHETSENKYVSCVCGCIKCKIVSYVCEIHTRYTFHIYFTHTRHTCSVCV